jgi:plasmid stabilization system protein ParE
LIVCFSAGADAELQLIKQWLAHEASEEVAEDLVSRIILGASKLARFPEMGRPTLHRNVRELVVASYILRYRVESKRVVVVRIRHGALKPLP